MKNSFSELIEKCKNLWNIIQQNRKIKYAVIAGLVGVVIIALGIFTALSIKESADIPSDVTAGPAISEYDNVTVIQIGDDDESDTDTDVLTSVDPDELESDSGSAEEDTDETEASSDETGEGTEDTENVQGDNEDTTVNDDPVPAGPSNTDSAATNDPANTQSGTKPPVTTQSGTKPPVTTQASTKPAETTKPAQTTTKPAEDTPQTSGQFVIKDKKYDYNGGNVTILNVENKSQSAYTITLTGKYKDASGNVIKTESKIFEGFPAGWSNYFVFNPGIKYDSFTFELTETHYNKNTIAQNVEFGVDVKCEARMITVDETGNIFIPTGIEELERCREVVAVYARFSPINNKNSHPVGYDVTTVLFDSNGKLCYIGNSKKNTFYPSETNSSITVPYYATDILWEDKNEFVLPENLKYVTGILAVNSVTKP